MILYSVFVDDVECPELIFQTYDLNKAKTFQCKYNKINQTETYDTCFITETDLDKVEVQADKTINTYQVYWRVLIIMKYNRIQHYTTKHVYLPLEEEYASNGLYGEIEVNLNEFTDPDTIDFSSEQYQNRIHKVIDEWITDMEVSE